MRFFLTILALMIIGILHAYCQSDYVQEGSASYYGREFHGRRTASGERFSRHKLTAAHPSLEFGTLVKVTNLDNGKSVIVKINDRGPSTKKRVIDVSYAAAKKLGMIATGTAQVRIESLSKKQASPTDSVPAADSENSDRTIFQLDVKEAKSEGWTVQIGNFGEAGNLMQLAATIKEKYSKPLLVETVTTSEKKVYRLLIGPEKKEEDAKALLVLVKKEYPDAFVIKLSQ